MAGKIFINYRRGDDAGHTGRLFDRLQDEFEPKQLFLDVDNIAPGLDFVGELNERVAECDVLLAVIGKGWIDARNATGARRLDDPDDFVRIEIASALSQGKRVIPVLVGEAQMPRPDELPEALRPLARRNAVRLTHERFRADTQGLIKALKQSLEEIGAKRQEREAIEQAKRESEEQARRDKEQARLTAIAALSPEQIAKAEELANWDFIKDSARPQDFHDHLNRFASGVCAHMARRRLEALAWAALGDAPDRIPLAAFLEAFPDSAYTEQATTRLASLDRSAAEQTMRRREAEEAEAQRQAELEKRRRNVAAQSRQPAEQEAPGRDADASRQAVAEDARTSHTALIAPKSAYLKTVLGGITLVIALLILLMLFFWLRSPAVTPFGRPILEFGQDQPTADTKPQDQPDSSAPANTQPSGKITPFGRPILEFGQDQPTADTKSHDQPKSSQDQPKPAAADNARPSGKLTPFGRPILEFGPK